MRTRTLKTNSLRACLVIRFDFEGMGMRFDFEGMGMRIELD